MNAAGHILLWFLIWYAYTGAVFGLARINATKDYYQRTPVWGYVVGALIGAVIWAFVPLLRKYRVGCDG